MIFPISNSKYKILRMVYENPEIKISDLLKKTKTSFVIGYRYIRELLSADIIEETLKGKKPFLRTFRPLFSETGKFCFSLVETDKKLEFFKMHKEFIGPFKQFEKEVKELINCAIIFGSFARGSAVADSDIDLMVLANPKTYKKIEKISESCFVTLKNRVELRLMDKRNFIKLSRKKDPLALQILSSHIVVVNPLQFVDIVAEVRI